MFSCGESEKEIDIKKIKTPCDYVDAMSKLCSMENSYEPEKWNNKWEQIVDVAKENNWTIQDLKECPNFCETFKKLLATKGILKDIQDAKSISPTIVILKTFGVKDFVNDFYYCEEIFPYIEEGKKRILPPFPVEKDTIPEIHPRDIFVVLINNNNTILTGIGSPKDTIEINENGSISSSLKESIKAFITNNGENTNSSDNPQKAIISLQNAKGTTYEMYIQVQNELTKVYNELRNEKSNLDYGKNFNELNGDEYKTIKDYYPMNISEADINPEKSK